MRPLLLEVRLLVVVMILNFDEVEVPRLPELLLRLVFGIFAVAVVSRRMVIVVLRGYNIILPAFPRSRQQFAVCCRQTIL